MYNESAICTDTLLTLVEEAQHLKESGYPCEIVFCDDGSTDRSGELLRREIEEWGYTDVKVIICKKNLGKGAAVREAVLNTDGDVVVYTDCDLAYGTEPILRAAKLIEEGHVDDIEITNYLTALFSDMDRENTKAIVLGCTHYPIIKNIIADSAKRILGGNIEIVDSGAEAAHETKAFLEAAGLTCDRKSGSVEYFVSDETVGFSQSASLFLGESINCVTKIDISDYHYSGKK
jgi:glycosyltransferase involved in cell wall biosynthesis